MHAATSGSAPREISAIANNKRRSSMTCGSKSMQTLARFAIYCKTAVKRHEPTPTPTTVTALVRRTMRTATTGWQKGADASLGLRALVTTATTTTATTMTVSSTSWRRTGVPSRPTGSKHRRSWPATSAKSSRRSRCASHEAAAPGRDGWGTVLVPCTQSVRIDSHGHAARARQRAPRGCGGNAA